MKNQTYITFLDNNEYMVGTIALFLSMKNQKCKYPLTVMISSKVNQKYISCLKALGINVERINDVSVSESIINLNINEMPHWSNTFGKLRVFGMTKFDKVVFVDSDMMLLKNIDELFEHENLSAVVAGKSFPGNESWQGLNSGLMVIEPKEGEDIRIINEIPSFSDKILGDQDIIHKYYSNWKNNCLELSEIYNVFFCYLEYYIQAKICSLNEIKIIHFTGSNKPWNMNFINKLAFISRLQAKKHFITSQIFIEYCNYIETAEKTLNQLLISSSYID